MVRRALVHDFGSTVLAATAATPAVDGGTARSAQTGHGNPAVQVGQGAAQGSQESQEKGSAATARGSGDRTVSVPVRAGETPAHVAALQRGWELAHWAVAHSAALHIERVGYADREWTADSGAAWQVTERHGADGKGGAGGKGGTGGGAQGPGGDRVLIVTAD
jgi:hypothetical protein